MADFKRLAVWRRSVELGNAIYSVTDRFPDAEKYGLTAQLRRASVSVSSNIAEGCGRDTDRELAHFLRIARGSIHEIESQLHFAQMQGLLRRQEWARLNSEIQLISVMLRSLIRSLSPARGM